MRRSKETPESNQDQSVMSRRRALFLLGVGATTAAVGLVGCAPGEQAPAPPKKTPEAPKTPVSSPESQKPIEPNKLDVTPKESPFYDDLTSKDQQLVDEIFEIPSLDDVWELDYGKRSRASALLTGTTSSALAKMRGESDFVFSDMQMTATFEEALEDPYNASYAAQQKLQVAFDLAATIPAESKRLQGMGINPDKDINNPEVIALWNRSFVADVIALGGLENPGLKDVDESFPLPTRVKEIKDALEAIRGGETLKAENYLPSYEPGNKEPRNKFVSRSAGEIKGKNGHSTTVQSITFNTPQDEKVSYGTNAKVITLKDGTELSLWSLLDYSNRPGLLTEEAK